MKILHFYPADNSLISQYVEMLQNSMQEYAEVWAEHSLHDFSKTLKQQHPDIIHVHGCWRAQNLRACKRALKQGARIVFSPHGQMEPWIMEQHFWRDKLPKLLAYQRKIAHQAYAIITMGRMEEGCLKKLKYNPRIETVYNALITETISQEEMGQLVYKVYRKVLDSDPWPLMNSQTQMAVRAFIKVGLTGNHLWLSNEEFEATKDISDEYWRKIKLYAHQEHIENTINQGITVLGLYDKAQAFNPQETDHYIPRHFDDAIRRIDTSGKNDIEKIVKALRSIKKLERNHHLTILHLVELSDLLRHSQADEEKVMRRMDDYKLVKFTQRMMSILNTLTGLEEGFMPTTTLDDNQTKNIKNRITKHLEII